MAVVLCACSGPEPRLPTTPTTNTSGETTGPRGPLWSVEGKVVSNPGGEGVASAIVDVAGQTVTADASGRFVVTSDQPTALKARISSTGFVAREVWLRPGASRTGVVVDLISTAAPFSLDFYRQLVRDGFESGAWLSILRWESAPRFYIKTVDGEGAAVPARMVETTAAMIRRGVLQWSAELFTPLIETGTAARPLPGWVNVIFTREQTDYCGTVSHVGQPGTLELSLDDELWGCLCGTNDIPPQLVLHEVGHVMGFWHTNDRTSTMRVGNWCRAGNDISPQERFHAAIAYSRPNGNLDPDVDPPSFEHLSRAEFARPIRD